MHHTRFLHLALLMALAACTAEPPADDDATIEPEDTLPSPPFSVETLPPDSLVDVQHPDSLPARPPVLRDSIGIEGMVQPERLTLVKSPAGFRPPFSTYLPSQMRAEFSVNDSAPSVRFVAEFGGQRNPDAYLQVKLYPRGSAELVPRTAIDVYLRGRDPRQDNVQESGGWPWTIAAYDFQYGGSAAASGFMGTIGLARHGNRYLHVLAHYPADYGDGIGPRIERILREWRWEDDGAPLVSRAAR